MRLLRLDQPNHSNPWLLAQLTGHFQGLDEHETWMPAEAPPAHVRGIDLGAAPGTGVVVAKDSALGTMTVAALNGSTQAEMDAALDAYAATLARRASKRDALLIGGNTDPGDQREALQNLIIDPETMMTWDVPDAIERCLAGEPPDKGPLLDWSDGQGDD